MMKGRLYSNGGALKWVDSASSCTREHYSFHPVCLLIQYVLPGGEIHIRELIKYVFPCFSPVDLTLVGIVRAQGNPPKPFLNIKIGAFGSREI